MRGAASLNNRDCPWTRNNSFCSPGSEHLEFALLSVLEERGRDEPAETAHAREAPQQLYGGVHWSSQRAAGTNSNALFKTILTLLTLVRCGSIQRPLPEAAIWKKKLK